MPGYLLLAGLMIGYILANIQAAKYDKYPEYLDNVYKRGMVIGIVVGILFAALYLGLYYA
jgi:xanthine/uracil permease